MNIVRSAPELGALVYTARKQKGWRQADLARAVAMRQQGVSDLERGRQAPRLDTIVRVLAALGLDLAVAPRQAAEFNPLDYTGESY